MASACALAIFSGKIIFYFGIAERLRTLRYSLFTEGVVKDNGIAPPPVKKFFPKSPQTFRKNKQKIFFPLFMPRAKRRAFKIVSLRKKAAARNVQQPFVCLSGYPVWHHSTMMLLPVISAGTGRPI